MILVMITIYCVLKMLGFIPRAIMKHMRNVSTGGMSSSKGTEIMGGEANGGYDFYLGRDPTGTTLPFTTLTWMF